MSSTARIRKRLLSIQNPGARVHRFPGSPSLIADCDPVSGTGRAAVGSGGAALTFIPGSLRRVGRKEPHRRAAKATAVRPGPNQENACNRKV